jgi:hypothetical protein
LLNFYLLIKSSVARNLSHFFFHFNQKYAVLVSDDSE